MILVGGLFGMCEIYILILEKKRERSFQSLVNAIAYSETINDWLTDKNGDFKLGVILNVFQTQQVIQRTNPLQDKTLIEPSSDWWSLKLMSLNWDGVHVAGKVSSFCKFVSNPTKNHKFEPSVCKACDSITTGYSLGVMVWPLLKAIFSLKIISVCWKE